jgi:hypothetical protein
MHNYLKSNKKGNRKNTYTCARVFNKIFKDSVSFNWDGYARRFLGRRASEVYVSENSMRFTTI